MKKVIVQFTYDAYIVEVPKEVAKDIRKHQDAFDGWLYDKNNDHGLWVLEKSEKQTVAFGIEDFVAFLNAQVLRDCPKKAKIVKSEKLKRQNWPCVHKKIYF